MNAGRADDRTTTVLRILHKYLYHEYAAWEEKSANQETKRHLLNVIGDALCILAGILDEHDRKPEIDDTRIFGYTTKEFNNLPDEAKIGLLRPLEFTVFEPVQSGSTSPWPDTQVDADPVQLPFTKSQYEGMSREEADKAIRDATCHMAHPVLRYKFKDEK